MTGETTYRGKKTRAHEWVRMGSPVVFIACCYGFLAAIPDLRRAVPELLGITAVLTVLLALIVYLCRRGNVVYPPAVILTIAACFRLLFVFHSPQLSDDIYRYLFDGRQLLSGRNPYAVAPGKADPPHEEMADLAKKINHPHLVTIYPPGAQLVFAVGALFGGITGMKLLLIGLDLALIAMMMQLLIFLDRSPSWAILYAWHPLSVLEISASGHIDGAGILLTFLSLYLLVPKPADGQSAEPGLIPNPLHPISPPRRSVRIFASGFLFTVAILVKFFPVVFLPGLWRLIPVGGKKWFFMGLLISSLLIIAPFLPDIQHSQATLKLYSSTWEFAGFFFRFLRGQFHSGTTARVILGVTFAVLIVWCYRLPARSGSVPSPPRVSLSMMLESGYAISLGFLLLTPTLHPWYALYLLSFLPFCPGVTGFTLSWSILLGYRVLLSYGILNEWTEDSVTPLMIWGGPIAAVIVLRFCRWSRLKASTESEAG